MNPTRELTFDHPVDAPMLVTRGHFTQHLDDVIEPAVYLPVKRALLRLGDLGRRIQNGSIHRYLAFSFAALLLVLLVVSL